MADDQIVHRQRGVAVDEGRRILRVGPQPKYQWVENPLDGAPQRSAVVAAEHLDTWADGTPCAVDDGTARLGGADRRRHLEPRTHLSSIKLGSVASARADANPMSTALLLGFAADQFLNIALFGFLVAGNAATLITDNRTAEVRPDADEAAERLVTAADMLAVRAAFDDMLLRKGLLTGDQLELIRTGTKSRGVVTGMRTTGESREDHREVEIDVMVRRPGGGQFPAHETALIPASSLAKVSPGCIIDTYYRSGDETSVAVCVSPS